MLYSLHEAAYYAATPMRAAARLTRDWWSSPLNPARNSTFGRSLSAGADLYENVTRRYGKPEWHIDEIQVNGHPVRVRQTVVWESAWCRLVQFDRDMADMRHAGKLQLDPAVLIVAPMSGHYATLLRGTVEAFAPDHAVFITDWKNARDVPMMEGRFDFDDYIEHIQQMLRALGHRAHVVAVCQPGPPVLAAAALMAEDNDPRRPRTMTFMGSPIDARHSPTVTNKLAEERPFTWFQSNMIYTVPAPYPGVGRRVYPGFVQLASFMSMNMERHKDAHRRYFDHLVSGDGDSADKHRAFYDEYLAVMDLTEEFYLQTIDKVFQDYALPKGELLHRDRLVRPAAITDIGLMTVEGELDDISGIGQTQAAHELCANIPADMKLDHVQEGVGHYGVFNGRRFREEIFPRVSAFIRQCDPDF
ncbi:MAG: polyhydroxyalkanoate depolymerase [Caulobacter sp.]|nr:polyhydroxyalkanoate depolymerase [Caulobacter sp.]